MIYLDLDLDLDLDLSKALIMFMCLVFKLKSTTLSGLPTNDILSRYKDQIESLQTQDVYLFTQVYKYVMRLCNQNPDLDTFHDLVPGKIVSDFDTLPDLPTLIASSRKIENMRNNALNLGAFPILASALRAATPSAATPSAAALYAPVASISGSDMSRKRKLTNEKPDETNEKKHKCNVCDYATNRKGHFTAHTRVHTREKPFQCPQCDYVAPYPGHLKRHMRKHTGERPYECTHESCNYKAMQPSDLTRHMRKHTGERPYECTHEGCDYKAKTASNLLAHKKRCKPQT
jgi:hypothetical protein